MEKTGKKKTILIGVIIFLLLGGIFTACESDPHSMAEDIIKNGFEHKILDSKIIAENSDEYFVAVKSRDDASNTYTFSVLVWDDKAYPFYLGIQLSSGETLGTMYDDVPDDLTYEQCSALSESQDALIQSVL